MRPPISMPCTTMPRGAGHSACWRRKNTPMATSQLRALRQWLVDDGVALPTPWCSTRRTESGSGIARLRVARGTLVGRRHTVEVRDVGRGEGEDVRLSTGPLIP